MRILICASDAPLRPTNTGFRRQLMGLVRELGERHPVRLIGYRHPDQSSNPAVEADMRIVPYVKPGPAGNARDLSLAVILGRPLRAERLVRGLRGALPALSRSAAGRTAATGGARALQARHRPRRSREAGLA